MAVSKTEFRKAEDARAIRALHHWMLSQGVQREDWGPIFAKAAGNEILTHCKDSAVDTEMGLVILDQLMEIAAKEDMVNI